MLIKRTKLQIKVKQRYFCEKCAEKRAVSRLEHFQKQTSPSKGSLLIAKKPYYKRFLIFFKLGALSIICRVFFLVKSPKYEHCIVDLY